MKKSIYTITGVVAIATLVLFACKKKQDDTIHPTYKEDATGTASNPQPNNVTVTGTSTVTNPATENSAIAVGGGGWSNVSCASTNSLFLKSVNGDTEVTINFALPIAVGNATYNVASSPGVGAVSIIVTKAPNQPSGAIWYGRSGLISVTGYSITGPPIGFYASAVITGTGVSCVQSTFNFPQVTLTGVLGCN